MACITDMIYVLILSALIKAESKLLQDYKVFKDKKFLSSDTTIKTVKTYSLMACAAICASDISCCAGYFDKDSQQCMIDTCCRPNQIVDTNGVVFAKYKEIKQNPADCDETENVSGSHTIWLNTQVGPVFCVMDEYCGGWTVIQQRKDGTENFDRDWNAYKSGFGTCPEECWLGNDAISALTTNDNYMLRIDLEDFDGNHRYALYDTFVVAGENDKYKLTVGGYSGTAGDAIAWLTEMNFSTHDSDNDLVTWNCATDWKSGWWYNACHSGNLNGEYIHTGTHNMREWTGICWSGFKGGSYSLKSSRMMIHRK